MSYLDKIECFVNRILICIVERMRNMKKIIVLGFKLCLSNRICGCNKHVFELYGLNLQNYKKKKWDKI